LPDFFTERDRDVSDVDCATAFRKEGRKKTSRVNGTAVENGAEGSLSGGRRLMTGR